MEIENLRSFLIVCRYKNITKAAGSLHLSQTALSRRIMVLESEIGVQLLVRNNRSIDLTPEGQEFLEFAEKAVALEDEIKAKMELVIQRNKIRIGYTPGMYMNPLYEIAHEMSQFYNNKDKMLFRVSSIRDLLQKLTKDEIDLAYIVQGEVMHAENIEIEHIRSNDLAIIIPKGHRLWNRNRIECAELEGETILLAKTEADPVINYEIQTWLSKNVKNLQFEMSNCTFSERLLMSFEGAGLCLSGALGHDFVQWQSEYYKKVLVSDAKLSYGDIVFAYKTGNASAAEFIRDYRMMRGINSKDETI